MNGWLRGAAAWGCLTGGALGLPTGCACAEAAPSPPPSFRCTLEARFDRLDDAHYVHVDGTSDLPDKAVLKLGVYYVKPASAIFSRADRPPPPPDLYLLDETDRILDGGRFDARLWILSRVPYPGTYRVRALLRWADQPAGLRGASPEDRDPLEWTVDLVNGTQEDLEQERASIRAEVKADIDRLAALQKELSARFREALREPAAAAWKGFADTVRAQVEPIRSRNERRQEFNVIWTETQGKYRIQDLSERLVSLIAECTRAVEARAAEVPREVEEQEKAFRAIFEGALNLLGFLLPVDSALVREHLGPIVEDFGRLEPAMRALQGNPPSGTPGEVAALRAQVVSHLRDGLGALLPVGPDQAVEPATRYTESVTAFFTDAEALIGGDTKKREDVRRHLEAARTSLQALREMMSGG